MNYFFSFIFLFFFAISSKSQTKVLDSLMSEGEFSKVVQMAHASTEKWKKNDAFLLAKAYLGLGNAKKASEVYQQNLEDGDGLQHFYSFGKLLLQQNQHQLADSIFTYLHQKNPVNVEFLYRLALAKQNTNEEEFKNTLYQAFDLQQNHLLVTYELAKEELKQKNYAVATRIAAQGLRIDESHTSLLSILGQAQFARGKWEESIESFMRLKEHMEAPLFIELRLAKAHAKLRNYKQSLQHYEDCLKKDPTDYSLYEEAAEIATLCGEADKALQYISQAFALKDVSRAHQFYLFGTVFLLKEDFERAIGLFKQCIDEDPNHEKATYALANAKDRFYADQQKILDAYQLYMDNFPEGNYYDLAEYRVKDLRKELFLKTNQQ